MGNCLGSEDTRSPSAYYMSDEEIFQKSDIYRPTSTSLFNTLRKFSECVVITDSSTKILYEMPEILCIDFENATSNSLKTLLGFKKIIYIVKIISSSEQNIRKIKANVSYSKYYIVEESIFNSFLQEFQIFTKKEWTQQQITTNKLPLLAFDSKQFINYAGPRAKIFIHSVSKKDAKVYEKMGGITSSMIINQPPENNLQWTKAYYIKALRESKYPRIVLLHSSRLSPEDIIEIISTLLEDKYSLPKQYGKLYLSRSLRISSPQEITQKGKQQEEIRAKTAKIIVSGVQKFQRLFQKLQEEAGAEKTERAHNLLSTLITNIYSNPGSQESYRQVKKANRQMNQLLTRFKSGLNLLDQLGFREKGEFWVNGIEAKYLKIYKTDFEVGYKKYLTHEVID